VGGPRNAWEERLDRLEEMRQQAAGGPVPAGLPDDWPRDVRAEEASFRAEQRQREGWPDKPVFVPRPDETRLAGTEVTDPGLRATARLEHLRGWGGPDVLRAMGWPDKAAELERLEAEHDARLNHLVATAEGFRELAQLLSLPALELAESIQRVRDTLRRGATVERHVDRLRMLRNLRRADRLRAVAGKETNRGKKRGRKAAWGAWKHPRKASGKAQNQRLPAAPGRA
jgi:hypothetical protein